MFGPIVRAVNALIAENVSADHGFYRFDIIE
jgi:hypothetical protein